MWHCCCRYFVCWGVVVAGSSVAVLSVLVWFDVLCDLRVDLLLGVVCGGVG